MRYMRDGYVPGSYAYRIEKEIRQEKLRAKNNKKTKVKKENQDERVG